MMLTLMALLHTLFTYAADVTSCHIIDAARLRYAAAAAIRLFIRCCCYVVATPLFYADIIMLLLRYVTPALHAAERLRYATPLRRYFR